MRKLLLKNLLLTLLFSFLSAGFILSMYYSGSEPGFEAGQVLFIILIIAEIFGHLLLFLSALPVLALAKPVNFANKSTRIVYYFGGPVALTILLILLIATSGGFSEMLLMMVPHVTFLSIHTTFYYRLVKAQQEV